jgi:outer membrane receptor protein involved in Fe transport
LQDVDLGGHKATLAFWGRNLFDEDAIKYAIPLGVVVSASYEAGRTVGLDVTVEF